MPKASKSDRVIINFKADEKMSAYLKAVVNAGGYGNNPTSAAQAIIWERIRALVAEGWIKQIQEPSKTE